MKISGRKKKWWLNSWYKFDVFLHYIFISQKLFSNAINTYREIHHNILKLCRHWTLKMRRRSRNFFLLFFFFSTKFISLFLSKEYIIFVLYCWLYALRFEICRSWMGKISVSYRIGLYLSALTLFYIVCSFRARCSVSYIL